MNGLHGWIAVLSLLVLSLPTFAQEPAKDAEPSIWMRKKLDYSRAILEGLSIADFDKIADNARAMQGLSRLEAFVRGRDASYRRQLQIFQAANEELIDQADGDNVEGAALAFTQVTISCVNCHKQLRQAEKPPQKTP
jgi:cytochrome c556